jgi:hypothetical protein
VATHSDEIPLRTVIDEHERLLTSGQSDDDTVALALAARAYADVDDFGDGHDLGKRRLDVREDLLLLGL